MLSLLQVSFCCKSFSVPVLEEVMRQYNTVSSSELKNLSLLMVELLCLSDPLQVTDKLCISVFIIIIIGVIIYS